MDPRGEGIERGPAVSYLRGVLSDVNGPRRETVLVGAALVAFGAWLYLTDLGGYALQSYDEGLYASMARNALQNGYWIEPHFYELTNGQADVRPTYEMPPLYPWLAALSIAVFGATEFGMRFPAAAAAVLTGVATWRLGAVVFDRATGIVAGFAFLTTPYLYRGANAGRQATTDTTFLLFGVLMVGALWLAVREDRPRLLLLAGVFGGLAGLTKGFAAGIFLLICAPLLLSPVVRTHWRWSAASAGVGAVVAGWWPVYMALKYELWFLEVFVLNQVIGRATSSSFDYVGHLPTFADPWLYFAVAGVVVGLRSEDRRSVAFLGWWAGIVLAFFSATGTHPHYILPMYVPLALLSGWLFSRVIERERQAIAATGIAILAAVGLSARLALTSLAFEWQGLWGHDPTRGQAPLLFLVGGVGALLLCRPVAERLARVGVPDRQQLLAAAVLCALLFSLIAHPYTIPWAYAEAQTEFGDELRAETPADATIYVVPHVTSENALFTVGFHAQRVFERIPSDRLPRSGYLLIDESTYGELERSHTVVARLSAKREPDVVAVRVRPG